MDSSQLAAYYQAFDARWAGVDWTQPVGLAQHRQALRAIDLDAPTYPGRFSYSDTGLADYLAGLDQVEQAVADCPDLGAMADKVADQLRLDRLAAVSARARDDQTYSLAQVELHGLPPQDLVDQARRSLVESGPAPEHRETITSQELVDRMNAALRAYELTGWRAEVEDNMASKASVDGTTRQMRVRAQVLFSEFDAARLIAHEVGGHVLRWANSFAQPEPWAPVTLGRTVPTEEGLAVCREAEFDLLDAKNMRKYEARCWAVAVGSQAGIMDILRAITGFVGRAEAVDIAIRAKEGLLDPNAPGGATKDWGYYAGFARMEALRVADPDGYRLLCAVKWTADDLDLIKQLHAAGRILPPELVPDRTRLGL